MQCHHRKFAERLEQMVGVAPIQFESAEFNGKYSVKSKDAKFAYDVINQGMMQFLLEKQLPAIEVADTAIGIFRHGRLAADAFRPNLDELVALRVHLPDYLFQG